MEIYFCSGLGPQGFLLTMSLGAIPEGVGRHFEVLGFQPGLVTCKASILLTVLSLSPYSQNLFFK